MLTVLLILIVVWGMVMLIVKRMRTRKHGPLPPQYPGAWPLIGHTHLVMFKDNLKLLGLFKDVYTYSAKNGGVISNQLGFVTIYVITDPDDCLTIADRCLKKHYVYDFVKDWLGSGLVTHSDVSSWKHHRKLLNPAFSHHVLNGFIGVFNSQARKLSDQLAAHVGKDPFNPDQYLMMNVAETTCLTTLNLSTDDGNKVGKEYIDATEKIFDCLLERFQKVWLYYDWIYKYSALKKRQDELVKISTKISTDIMMKRKFELLNNNDVKLHSTNENEKSGKFKPLLDLVLELAIKDNSFTDREVREHLDTMVVANYDTTRTTLIYILAFIGSFKNVQDKMYNELLEVFGDSDRDVEKEDYEKLIYMEAVIKETVRMYPPVPSVGRYTETEVKLKNYTLPAGSSCVMSLYGLHRHPSWGPDAETFKPERWLDPAMLPSNPNAFGGFSLGKRSCIGKRYAFMMIKTFLSHLLRKYEVASDISKLVQKMDVILRPMSGHEITLRLR